MRPFRIVLACALVAGLSACSPKPRGYTGPEVTRILVYKSERLMYLMHHDEILSAHRIALGFAPDGHKRFEGDGRTPVGQYFIDRRNPYSKFHLSLGISYPGPEDIAAAREAGKSPGGDIMIHGSSKSLERREGDWTWGCIAVTNEEIEQIYRMVKLGTVIDIYP